jgi:hypothetical protein
MSPELLNPRVDAEVLHGLGVGWSPDFFEDLLVREHSARVTDEECQELKLNC